MEEKKALRRKSAERTVNRIRLWRQVLSGEFDDLTDEEFAEKLDIIPDNRTLFIKYLRDTPGETEENIEEIIALYIVSLYIVGELSDVIFLKKLSALDFIESYFEDADDPWPEDYRAGTLDILRNEQSGFHTFNQKTWESILKIAEYKNMLVIPEDYTTGITPTSSIGIISSSSKKILV